jgi:hypothetical protein
MSGDVCIVGEDAFPKRPKRDDLKGRIGIYQRVARDYNRPCEGGL